MSPSDLPKAGAHTGIAAIAEITGKSEAWLEDAMTSRLTWREMAVLQMRFRLGDYEAPPDFKPAKLESIGDVFALTRERIRQLECSGLRKLKDA